MALSAVRARDVLSMTTDEIWELFDRPRYALEVEFDDDIMSTSGRELIFSQYFWNFHRAYPDTPLLKSHLMSGAERLNKKTSLTLIGTAFWSVWDQYRGQVKLDDLQRLAYEVTNLVYNEIVLRMPEYITSISAKDITDVLYHPELVKALTDALPTQNSIKNVGDLVQDLLTREGELVGNRPAESAKSGLVSAGQQNQIFGLRGFVTEIDSNVFRTPIMTGYGHGMHKLHDYAVESRSASKALFFAKDPLADVEYLNRQLQLLAQSMKHLFKGDCGSTVMLPLHIANKRDLKTYDGKYYYAEDPSTKQPTLYRVTPDDTFLVGKTIMARSPLGCRCLPNQGVCQACLGEISLQIPDNANLGHLSIIELCSGVSQNVLSTKHLDSSSSVERFYVSEADKIYLDNGSKDSLIKLSSAIKGRNPVLVVNQSAAFNLTELHHVKDLSILPITRISAIDYITIECDDLENPGSRILIDLPVSVGSRRASFTPGFLAYIKRRGWVATEARTYRIELKGWDFTKDAFELPLKNVNTMEFMKEVEGIIKFNRLSRRREKRAKELARSPDELAALVVELHDTVNRRFTFNIAHCELILSLCLVRSAKNNDYRFPSPTEDREFAPFKELMNQRSMAVAYAFEKHGRTLLNLDAFLNPKRVSHPMDCIYVPEA